MERDQRKNVRDLSLEEMKAFFVEHGEKAFRAKQLYEWLWSKSTRSFDQMTNLSKDLRKFLDEHFELPAVTLAEEQISNDRTIKNAFKLADGKITEGVLIPAPNRMTACISSQIGCSLACKFCATGKLKLMRNIRFDEIYDQVSIIKEQAEKHYQQPLTNIVYMGMGEPLLNYNQMMRSIERITAEDGLGMSPKRITVYT
jgi:23S rRNA (adenine2503-C2)-methyltransferase